MEDRFWELLSRFYANRMTPAERLEFEQLLLEYPDAWLKVGKLQQIDWTAQPLFDDEQANALADKILAKQNENNRKKKNKPKSVKILAATSFMAIAVIISLVLWKKQDKENSWQNITTANGMKTTVNLSDGTEIRLNAGSTLRYPEELDKNIREVYLDGEGYFKIKHESGRPFIIHTSGITIRDLGTEFDVRAYADEMFSEISLIEGSVAVSLNNSKQKDNTIYLKPLQKIIVKKEFSGNENNTGGNDETTAQNISGTDVQLKPLTPEKGNIYTETAWKEDLLVFDDESLDALSKQMERWYGIHIVITDSILAKQHFTGRADNVPVEKLLHILQMIKPFDYSINGKQVIIKSLK